MSLDLLRRIFAFVLMASGAVSYFKKSPETKKNQKNSLQMNLPVL